MNSTISYCQWIDVRTKPFGRIAMSGNRVELRKFVAPEFLYGSGALSLTGRYAQNLGGRKALVVTDPGVIEAGWADKVCESLRKEGISTTVFSDITPNPKDYEVEAGRKVYAENQCNIIVAIGGGSPMDCAKGIGIAHANNCSVLDFEGVDEVPLPGPPLICIPTTAGTSADVSQFAIITDSSRKIKIAIVSKMVVPDVALIDPETTTTMPSELTAATGLDALVHAIESYVSNANSPVTDLNALQSIHLISNNLLAAINDPHNLIYRDQMMTASLLAGLAFSNASLGLVHAMAHAMGGLLGSPHGLCNALLLESVIQFNYPTAVNRYDRIAKTMGIKLADSHPDEHCGKLLEGIASLSQQAGIKRGISNLGVSPATIPQLAQNAFNDACAVTNPRPAGTKEIEAIYERAL